MEQYESGLRPLDNDDDDDDNDVQEDDAISS